MLLRLINALKPPETVNFEHKSGNKDKVLRCAFSKCFMFKVSSYKLTADALKCTLSLQIHSEVFLHKIFASLPHLVTKKTQAHTQADTAEEKKV